VLAVYAALNMDIADPPRPTAALDACLALVLLQVVFALEPRALAACAALNMDIAERPRTIAVLAVKLVVRERDQEDFAQVPHAQVASAAHNMDIVEPPQTIAELGAKLDALAAAAADPILAVMNTLLLLPGIALSLTPALMVHVSLDLVEHIPL